MTCREYLPLINDLADGNINLEVEKKTKSHLNECRDCNGELNQTKKLKRLLKNFRTPQPDRKYYSKATSQILGRIAGITKTGHSIN